MFEWTVSKTQEQNQTRFIVRDEVGKFVAECTDLAAAIKVAAIPDLIRSIKKTVTRIEYRDDLASTLDIEHTSMLVALDKARGVKYVARG